MDSNRASLENISKSRQVAIIDKICNLQWLKHNTHLSVHTKSRLDRKDIQHSENEQVNQQLAIKLDEDEEQNEKKEIKIAVSHVDESKQKDRRQKVQKIVSNVNKNKDQIKERKVEEIVSVLEKGKEQEEKQKVIDSREYERQTTEYVESDVISKSIEDKSTENPEIVLLIPDTKCDTNTENDITDEAESLTLTSEESSKNSLMQEQLSISQDVKEEKIHNIPHDKEHSKQCAEMQQAQYDTDKDEWTDSISNVSENEDKVKVEKQSGFDSNNDILNCLTKDISQINLNISLKKVKNGENDDNVRVFDEKQELSTDANIILDTNTTTNGNSEWLKGQAHKTYKEEFILKMDTDKKSKELNVQLDESNKEELIPDKIQLDESNRNNHETEGSRDNRQTKVNYSTTSSKDSSDKIQIELNKSEYGSNDSRNMQNKMQWTHSFMCSRSFFKSNSTKIDKQFPLQSRKGIESVTHCYSNSFLGKDEESMVTCFNTNSADVRRNTTRVYYIHSKQGIEKIQTKEDDKLSKNVTRSMFSFDKKMTEHTNNKTIVTTNEKEKSVRGSLNTKQCNENIFNENTNFTKGVNESNFSNLKSKNNVPQYANVQAYDHLSLNRNMELRNTNTQNLYLTPSSTNFPSNYMTVNSSMNNNFTDRKQAFIPNIQAPNVLCVHQAFHPQNPYNVRVCDGFCFNTASKEQEHIVNYPAFHYNNDFTIGQERNYMYQSTCFQPLYPTNWNGYYTYTMPFQICHSNCNTFDNRPVVHTNMNSWSNCDQMYQRIPIDLQNKSDLNNGTESNGSVKDSEEYIPPIISPKACMLAANELPTTKENLSDRCIKKGSPNLGNTLQLGQNNTRSEFRRNSTNFGKYAEGVVYNTSMGRGKPKRFKK